MRAATATGASAPSAVDRTQVDDDLDATGVALLPGVLPAGLCAELVAMYDRPDLFRSTIDMGRYRFGEGQYRYFAAPLPGPVDELRHTFWPIVLAVARRWAAQLGAPAPWPDDLDEWLAQCHAAGQARPTPLLLRYGAGDWNALHRDLYGDLVFPLQVVFGLDRPGVDYDGGEFVVVEQRPRAQSRATVTRIGQGDAVIFTTRDRPVRSARGWSAAPMRHGVSTVRRGRRHALGIPFHDAT
jgi:hypothetical protein